MNRVFRSITLDGRRLRVFPSVYKPLDNEQGLVDSVPAGKSVLDMGCGSGVLTVFAALKSKHVTAVDINPEAVRNTVLNCQAHGITNVTVEVSDMFRAVEGAYDYIISYPPLFRFSFAAKHQQWATSTYFMDELFANAPSHLAENGRLVLMLPKAYRCSAESLAQTHGFSVEGIHRKRRRTLALRLHAVPYLHLSLNLRVYVFARTSSSDSAEAASGS